MPFLPCWHTYRKYGQKIGKISNQSLKKYEIILSLQDLGKELYFQLSEENEKSCRQRHCLLLSSKRGTTLLAAKHDDVQNLQVKFCGAHEAERILQEE